MAPFGFRQDAYRLESTAENGCPRWMNHRVSDVLDRSPTHRTMDWMAFLSDLDRCWINLIGCCAARCEVMSKALSKAPKTASSSMPRATPSTGCEGWPWKWTQRQTHCHTLCSNTTITDFSKPIRPRSASTVPRQTTVKAP